ncbi:MAG: tetraacyldisaccharide 4'-kinase [Cyclobacteriaceae bacterium]|nr:tetraacyldisaccharide 4'-kinase [Cyclobacteriaceae bacterium]
MSFLRYLWWPFAVLVDGIMRVRNYLYRIGHKKSFQFETVVISVGNLNVGGSGKTPMVEYLIRLLSPHYRIATLSRGYGRTTSGFRLAGALDNARTIGDEPFQLYKKFKNQIYVAVGEERALAIPTILNERPDVQVILLDDAFQHRAVVPQFSILITDFQKPFYKDALLPMGRLRENRYGAARADVVVVTKCQANEAQALHEVSAHIARYAPGKPVFFSTIKYASPLPMCNSGTVTGEVILVTGIGNPKPFEQHIAKDFKIHRHFRFADHHRYTVEDVSRINREADGRSIMTTEKDMVKLINPDLLTHLQQADWFYLPMETGFLVNGSEFDGMMQAVVAEKVKEAATPGNDNLS